MKPPRPERQEGVHSVTTWEHRVREREEKVRRSEVVALVQAQPGGQWDKRWTVVGRELGTGAGAGACGVLPRSLDFIQSVVGGFEHETGLI